MQIRTTILALMLMANSASLFAAEIVKLGVSGTASVRTIIDEDGAYLLARLPGSAEQRIPEEDFFGRDYFTFFFNDKETELAAFDVDGDGVQEFMVRTMATPMMSAVYVYKWNSEDKKFNPIKFGKKDFLGAGVYDLKLVIKDGKPATITFNVQPIAEFGAPAKQTFSYAWSKGSFKKVKK